MFFDPATGHIVFEPSTGHMAKGCRPPTPGCMYCPDGTTPAKWRVTLDGIDIATCNAASGAAGTGIPCADGPHTTREYNIASISGTWDVPRLLPPPDSDFCYWLLRVPNFATETLRRQFDCVVTDVRSVDLLFIVRVGVLGTLDLVVALDAPFPLGGQVFSGSASAFPDLFPCDEVVDLDNDLTVCGDVSHTSPAGINGTATLTPLAA